MPGPEVKDWHVYEECMKDKEKIEPNKTYCAKVANAVASGSIKHSDLMLVLRYNAEKGLSDFRESASS